MEVPWSTLILNKQLNLSNSGSLSSPSSFQPIQHERCQHLFCSLIVLPLTFLLIHDLSLHSAKTPIRLDVERLWMWSFHWAYMLLLALILLCHSMLHHFFLNSGCTHCSSSLRSDSSSTITSLRPACKSSLRRRRMRNHLLSRGASLRIRYDLFHMTCIIDGLTVNLIRRRINSSIWGCWERHWWRRRHRVGKFNLWPQCSIVRVVLISLFDVSVIDRR